MAGLRQGYAVAHKASTAAKIRGLQADVRNERSRALGHHGSAGRSRTYLENEVKRNTEVRKFTMDFFRDNGYWVSDSQTNFIFAKTNMPAKDFREACAKFKVHVGRDFPPYEKELRAYLDRHDGRDEESDGRLSARCWASARPTPARRATEAREHVDKEVFRTGGGCYVAIATEFHEDSGRRSRRCIRGDAREHPEAGVDRFRGRDRHSGR